MKIRKDEAISSKFSSYLYNSLSKDERLLLIKASDLLLPTKDILTFNDLINFEKAKELLFPIKEKYKISIDDLFTYVREPVFIPISIFNNQLTVLESVVKYLKKEEKNFALHKVSDIIERDERNVWHIYNNSKKKYSSKFIIKDVKFWIPILIFSGIKLSALECIVAYIKDELNLSYHEIAVLLKRDDRTIWTVYQRARRKNAK